MNNWEGTRYILDQAFQSKNSKRPSRTRRKTLEGEGVKNCMSPSQGPWVFENQRIVSGILTQQKCYKKAEANLLADEKGP